MWGKMRDWLKHAVLPKDDELRTDLIGPEYGFDNKNRIQLERKKDMKARGLASPDVGDALALTFAVDVHPIGDRESRQPNAVMDFDPFTFDAGAERRQRGAVM